MPSLGITRSAGHGPAHDILAVARSNLLKWIGVYAEAFTWRTTSWNYLVMNKCEGLDKEVSTIDKKRIELARRG
jgi:hypothetical protein